MKPFNLEEAKAGKPVCTRDGRRVEIISFENPSDNYPILAKVCASDNEIIIVPIAVVLIGVILTLKVFD